MAYLPPLNGGRINASIGGNTTGASSARAVSTGTIVFAGGNNITLSQATGVSGATISINGGGGASLSMYGVGNTTQNTSALIDARSVSLNGLGALSVGYSNGSVQLSAPVASSLSVTGILSMSTTGATVSMGVPAYSAGISAGFGNTSGTSGFATNQLVLAGGNNITLSQATGSNGNSLTISAPNIPSGSINFSAGTTSGNLSAVVFSNSNGVGFGLNGSVLTASYSQSGLTQNISALGNTASVSTGSYDGRSIRIAGLGAASAGVSNSSVMFISVPTQTTQPAIGGISANGSLNTSGTISFANSNGIGFGLSSGTMTASHNGITSQSIQTQNTVSINGSSGAISFTNGGNVSFGGAASAITASYSQTNQTVGINVTGNTIQSNTGTVDARNLTFNGLGNVSVGYSNGSVQISGSGGGGGLAVSGGGSLYSSGTLNMNASGALTIASTTGTALNFSVPSVSTLSGTGIVSVSAAGSVISVGASQSIQTIGLVASGANSFGTASSTRDARSVSISGMGAVSVGFSSTDGIFRISAPTQTTQPAIGGISASGGSATSGTVSFASSNGITFGMNGQTMTASHNGITSQSNQLINFTATGANTTMNSTGSFDARSMVVSGAGNVKVGISSNTMYISAAGGGGVAIAPTGATYTSGTVGLSAMSPLGLSTTNNQTISITAPALSSIVGINGINLATSGNTLSIDGSAIQPGTLSNWEPIMLQNASLTTGTVGAKSIMFMKLSPQAYINASQLLQLVSGALSVTVNSTHRGTLSVQAGIYTANGSTLSLITQSSGSASYTWSNSSSNNTSFFAGLRGITLPMNINMSPGNYWLGLWSNSTFSNTNVVAMSNMVMSFNAGGAAGFGGLLGQAPNVTAGVQEGVGVYSVTSANLHANAAMSGISQSAFSRVSAPYLNFKNITW